MSLYCAKGSVESDLLAQLRDLFAESLAKLGQRTAFSPCPPTKAACIPAPAN